jgi:hypothetical protein
VIVTLAVHVDFSESQDTCFHGRLVPSH